MRPFASPSRGGEGRRSALSPGACRDQCDIFIHEAPQNGATKAEGIRRQIDRNGLDEEPRKKVEPVFCKSGAKPIDKTVRRFPLIA
jgi:hypothetical protein